MSSPDMPPQAHRQCRTRIAAFCAMLGPLLLLLWTACDAGLPATFEAIHAWLLNGRHDLFVKTYLSGHSWILRSALFCILALFWFGGCALSWRLRRKAAINGSRPQCLLTIIIVTLPSLAIVGAWPWYARGCLIARSAMLAPIAKTAACQLFLRWPEEHAEVIHLGRVAPSRKSPHRLYRLDLNKGASFSEEFGVAIEKVPSEGILVVELSSIRNKDEGNALVIAVDDIEGDTIALLRHAGVIWTQRVCVGDAVYLVPLMDEL